MSQRSRRGSIVNEPEKIIPTFSIPWIHRDKWNDKEWFYAIEGNLLIFPANLLFITSNIILKLIKLCKPDRIVLFQVFGISGQVKTWTRF